MIDTNSTPTTSQYLGAAEQAAAVIPGVLAQRGLEPRFSRFILYESDQAAWLFAVLDTHSISDFRIEKYNHPELLHQMKAAVRGRPVILSNSTGLRYAILLSPRPTLPVSAVYPGWKRGVLQIGVDSYGQPVETNWEAFGHGLIAGMTGSGKSIFLRLLISQAIDEGYQLALADPDGRTFPMLAGHKSLLAPMGLTMDGCEEMAKRVLQELIRRKSLYDSLPPSAGYVDKLDDYNKAAAALGREILPRLVVAFDEFNTTVMQTGGPKAQFAKNVADIANRGRKWGVTLLLAGQEFTRELIGPVSGQLASRICFRVATRSTSQVVYGQAGAEKIKQATPGRAWTTWGLAQSYFTKLDITPTPRSRLGLTDEEAALAIYLRDSWAGRMSRAALLSKMPGREREARRLREEWKNRGLVETVPSADNALCLTARVLEGLTEWEASQPVGTVGTVGTPQPVGTENPPLGTPQNPSQPEE